MNEFQAQRLLYLHFGNRFLAMVPNYTPRRWWECDLFGLTKNGYSVEFEIKVSNNDFRADARKAQETGPWRDRQRVTKHSLLADRSERCPNRFFFVVPAVRDDDTGELSPMLTVDEVPEWAGLIYVVQAYRYGHLSHIRIAKPAPRLHNAKPKKTLTTMAHTCYYRYWTMRMQSPADVLAWDNDMPEIEPATEP